MPIFTIGAKGLSDTGRAAKFKIKMWRNCEGNGPVSGMFYIAPLHG